MSADRTRSGDAVMPNAAAPDAVVEGPGRGRASDEGPGPDAAGPDAAGLDDRGGQPGADVAGSHDRGGQPGADDTGGRAGGRAGDAVPGAAPGPGGEPPGGRPLGWDDDGLGDRIRPYALTGGRTRSADDLPLETLVVRTAAGSAALPRTVMERRKILDLCERPLSIAEISAYVGVHLGVARVLVGDMKGEGLLDVHQLRAAGDRPDIKLLERVLDGLQAL